MTAEQATWRKSSYSGSQTNCVEVARFPGVAGVRDSKARHSGELRVSRAAWSAFLAGVPRQPR
jgi:hypothetical protein